jgi:hypothetical protein
MVASDQRPAHETCVASENRYAHPRGELRCEWRMKTIAILALAAVAFGFSACSSDDDVPASTYQSTSTTTTGYSK